MIRNLHDAHSLSNAFLSCTLSLGASSVTLGLSFLCYEDDRESLGWWYTPVTPALRKQRWRDFEFKPSLDHLVNSRPVCPTEKDFVYKQTNKQKTKMLGITNSM